MALGTPTLTVTINAIPKVLSRIADDGYTSEYLLRDTLDEFRLKVRHSSYSDSNRGGQLVDRHNIELTQTVYPVSPAIYSTKRKAYVVMENDHTDLATSASDFDDGLIAFITAAVTDDLINWVN